jgi:hypothetical protein
MTKVTITLQDGEFIARLEKELKEELEWHRYISLFTSS